MRPHMDKSHCRHSPPHQRVGRGGGAGMSWAISAPWRCLLHFCKFSPSLRRSYGAPTHNLTERSRDCTVLHCTARSCTLRGRVMLGWTPQHMRRLQMRLKLSSVLHIVGGITPHGSPRWTLPTVAAVELRKARRRRWHKAPFRYRDASVSPSDI